MTYDFILMNPPYGSIGGPVTTEAKKHANKTVCLMPLSCYKNKSNELWRYVESMELADPKMFDDADIGESLCIATIFSEPLDINKSYNDLEIITYDVSLKPFYKTNATLPKRYAFQRCDNASVDDFDFEKDYVDGNRLVNIDFGFMNGGNGIGYRWNVMREQNIFRNGLSVIHFGSGKERKNFTTWAYSDVKNGLANKLIWGIKKQTVSDACSIAIPQIDWETISDTPLWKEGKYDEAVLDAMDLKWDGDVIVEERKL